MSDLNCMHWILGTAVGFSVLGCGSRPGRVDMPNIDPGGAASAAMEINDANGDGKLSKEELRGAPGILVWKNLYDLDSDGFVTEVEIRARLEKWQHDKLGFRTAAVSLKLEGRPLRGVTVELIPEPYLGESIKKASGRTNGAGIATLSVAPDDLPETLKSRGLKMSGVTVGTYKIALSHPQLKLPTSTRDGKPLGQEIARDTILETFELDLGRQ